MVYVFLSVLFASLLAAITMLLIYGHPVAGGWLITGFLILVFNLKITVPGRKQ